MQHSKEKFSERELKPQWFFITVRRPTGNDPGQIAEGWYTLSADMVVMLVDRDGTPIENVESATVTEPKYAAAAARLLRDHRAGRAISIGGCITSGWGFTRRDHSGLRLLSP